MIVGSHMSIAKGLDAAVRDSLLMQANTMQFFTRNPRGSSFREPCAAELERFQRLRKDERFGPLLAHAPYTMNLASAKEDVYLFGYEVIREDIARMDALQIEYLVLHPGSHTGAGTDSGIRRIVQALNDAVSGRETITILLETMSGKGTEIGSRFEELRAILDGVRHPERFGVCLDTCHVFAAGYDIVREPDAVLARFDRIISLEKLRAVHLNDSMMPFGSRKDRHAVVGDGQIGLDALVRILTHPALCGLPFYLETPLDEAGHAKEIALLRKAASSRQAATGASPRV